MALGGFTLGDVKQATVLEPTYIVIQVPLALRAQINRVLELPIDMPDGGAIALAELGRFVRSPQDPVHYYKDLRPVEYVVADVAGRLAAPIYGMTDVERSLRHYHGEDSPYVAADGATVTGGTMTGPPSDDGRVAFEWTGEWTVTYETFRDMGIAFAAALVLIYILVVWEFGNFVVPLVIMAPIPLTLIGIVPGHALLGWLTGSGEFTATSMIGFIALAGIIVRNSILLVDFTLHEMRNGADVQAAVVLACKARTRPILITALALVAGSFVILADPIFQGMAISLLFGVLVSTVLTLVVIPLGCVTAHKSMYALACARSAADGGAMAAAAINQDGNAAAAEMEADIERDGERMSRAWSWWLSVRHVGAALLNACRRWVIAIRRRITRRPGAPASESSSAPAPDERQGASPDKD